MLETHEIKELKRIATESPGAIGYWVRPLAMALLKLEISVAELQLAVSKLQSISRSGPTHPIG